MRKFVTTLLVGSALSLTACAGTETDADYSYETQAPFADERTVGTEEEVVVRTAPPQRAERVFERQQRK